MNKIIITILFLLLAGLTGCATKTTEQVLQSTLRSYERVLRWGDIAKTNNFRKEPISLSAAEKQKFKFIKVTSYDVQNITRPDDLTVKVEVALRYYHKDYAREKTIEDHQVWQHDAKKKLWFLSSPLPKF